MALETPNRLAGSILFFFADTDALPPALSNDPQAVITAQEGIAAFHLMPDEAPFTGEPTEGFFLELMHPVNVGQSSWFFSGPPGQQATDGSMTFTGSTPVVENPNTGVATVDDWAATNGNFLCLNPDVSQQYGWFGVAIWEIPRVQDAELPNLPLEPAPVPP